MTHQSSLAEARTAAERARGLFADWVYDATSNAGKPVITDAARVRFGRDEASFVLPALTHPTVVDDLADTLVDAANDDPAYRDYDVEADVSLNRRSITLRFIPRPIPNPHD